MEAIKGREGGYREQTGSSSSSYNISSSSGTLSTAYASSGSRPSSLSMEAALHLEEMEKKGTEFVQPPGKRSRKETDKSSPYEKVKRIKILVKEFFCCAPSAAKFSSTEEGGDMRVLERWFTELGVGWLLHLPLAGADDGAPAAAGKLEHQQALDASSWIRALTEITDSFCLLMSFLFSPGSVEEGGPVTESEEQYMTDQFQYARFTQEAMMKMLGFVDVICAPNLTYHVFTDIRESGSAVSAPAYSKLHILLGVRRAVSNALSRIQGSSSSWVSWRLSAESKKIQGDMVGLLLAKESKANEAIWSEVEEARNRILESLEGGGDSCACATQSPQGSPDIHEATPYMLSYIRFLRANYWTLEPVVTMYVPRIGDLSPLDSMIIGMASCLEQKLANKSDSFLDESLRFLFLLNNSSFIQDQLHCYVPKSYKAALSAKVEGYMESYIQSSWAPVLACLFNDPTPGCFGKNSSPLPKFESEFHKTFITQKLWKVPDPRLRKKLRKAIADKIISVYTKYIQDNNVTTPRVTPQDLDDMLQELFEG